MHGANSLDEKPAPCYNRYEMNICHRVEKYEAPIDASLGR